MVITKTLSFKFHRLNKKKSILFEEMAKEWLRVKNELLDAPTCGKTTTRFVKSTLKSALLNSAIRQVRKAKKFKRARIEINNQNWRITKQGKYWTVSFPTLRGEKRIPLEVCPWQQAEDVLSKLRSGELKKRKGWHISIPVEFNIPEEETTSVIGIDRGQRFIAVAVAEKGQTKFFRGGKLKDIRRHYASLRKRLQKKKRRRAIRKIARHENRIINAHLHTVSRRKDTKSDAGENRDFWCFKRLEEMIRYKAAYAGLITVSVASLYTSKACSRCGKLGVRSKNHFYCPSCSYRDHADRNSAINIRNLRSGESLAGRSGLLDTAPILLSEPSGDNPARRSRPRISRLFMVSEAEP